VIFSEGSAGSKRFRNANVITTEAIRCSMRLSGWPSRLARSVASISSTSSPSALLQVVPARQAWHAFLDDVVDDPEFFARITADSPR